MKETVIDFNNTVKETPIDFSKTVPNKKESKPWYATLWKNPTIDTVKAFGQSIKTVPSSLIQKAAGLDLMALENPDVLTIGLGHLSQPIKAGVKSGIAFSNKVLEKMGLPTFTSLVKPAQKAAIDSVKKTGIEKQSQNIEKIKQDKGIKPGSIQEKAFNLGQGFFETSIDIGLMLATKSSVPMLASIGAKSAGSTYASARMNGADKDKALIASLGNGTVDIVMSKIPVENFLKPSKSFISSVIRNTFGEVVEESLSELIKSGIEKGTITPDLTLEDAVKRMLNAGINAAILTPIFTVATYPLVKAAEYKANTAAEAARTTLESEGIEVKQPLLEEAKPLSEAEINDIVENQRMPEDVLREKLEANIKPREEALSYTLEEKFDNQLRVLKEKLQAEEAAGTDIDNEVLVDNIDENGDITVPPTELDTPSNPKKSKISKFRTNTIERTTELTDTAKTELIQEEFRYITEDSLEWEQKAYKNLNDNPTKVVENILDPNKPINSVGIYEGAIVAKQMEKLVDTPEGWSKYLNFMKAYAAKVREAARVMKATDTAWQKMGADAWSRVSDPSAYMKNVIDFIEGAQERLFKDRPDIKEQFDKMKTKGMSKKDLSNLRKKLGIPDLSDEVLKRIFDIHLKVKDLPPTNIKRKMAAIEIRKIVSKEVDHIFNSGFKRFSQSLLEWTNGALMWTADSLVWLNNISNALRFFEENVVNDAAFLTLSRNPKLRAEVKNRFNGEIEALRQMIFNNPVVGEVIDPTTNRIRKVKGKTVVETLDNFSKELLSSDPRKAIEKFEDFLEATELRGIGADESKSDLSRTTRRLHWGDFDDPSNFFNTIVDLGCFLAARAPMHLNRVVDNGYKNLFMYGEAKAEIGRIADATGLVGEAKNHYEAQLWDDFSRYVAGDPNPMTSQQLKIVEEVFDKALKHAEYSTGQGELPGFLEDVNKALNSFPIIKMIAFRFFRMPINWVKYSIWDSMPYSKLLVKQKRDLILGKRGSNQDITKARINFGISLLKFGLLYAFAASFQVTGKHPSKDKQKRFKAGIPEEAIYNPITKKWMGYGRYDQIARPLSALATILDNMRSFPQTDEVKEKVGASLLAFVSTLDAATGSITLQDIGNLWKSISPDYYGNTAVDPERNFYVKSQVKAFLPFSGLTKSLQRGSLGVGLDEHYREIETIWDVPASVYNPKALKPKLNAVTGKILNNPGSSYGITISDSDLEENPGLLKMYQLGIPMNPPSETIFGYQLDDKQHWEYQRLIDEKYHMDESLNKLVTEPGFDDLPKAIQRRRIEKEISRIRTIAGLDYLQSNGLFEKALDGKLQTKMKDYLKNTGELPDLSNPNTTIDFLNFPETE